MAIKKKDEPKKSAKTKPTTTAKKPVTKAKVIKPTPTKKPVAKKVEKKTVAPKKKTVAVVLHKTKVTKPTVKKVEKRQSKVVSKPAHKPEVKIKKKEVKKPVAVVKTVKKSVQPVSKVAKKVIPVTKPKVQPAKVATKDVSKKVATKIVSKEVIIKPVAHPKKVVKPTPAKEPAPTKTVFKPSVRYSDGELESFRIRILELKKETMEELGMLKDRLDDLNNYDFAEESMIYSMHMAEQGSEAMEKEKTYAQIQRINEYLKKLDEALERIKLKTYGVCRVCNCLIAKERLMAVPITTLSASYKIHKKCPEDGIDRIEPLKH